MGRREIGYAGGRRSFLSWSFEFCLGLREESDELQKLVDPIKCRKAFKEESRRAGRTGLDGAIN